MGCEIVLLLFLTFEWDFEMMLSALIGATRRESAAARGFQARAGGERGLRGVTAT
jgi:hypothetical protein